MGRWRLVFAGAAIAAAIPVATSLADPASLDTATGGGEVIVRLVVNEPFEGEGPFTTVAFTARQLQPGDPAADGEIQEVDRHSQPFFVGPGRGSIFHGKVVCLRVVGDEAVLLYRARTDTAPDPRLHQLYIKDNGEGQEDDVIIIDRDPTAPCVVTKPSGTEIELGRGNVQLEDGG